MPLTDKTKLDKMNATLNLPLLERTSLTCKRQSLQLKTLSLKTKLPCPMPKELYNKPPLTWLKPKLKSKKDQKEEELTMKPGQPEIITEELTSPP